MTRRLVPPSVAMDGAPPPLRGKRRRPSLASSAITFSTGLRTVSTVGGWEWFMAKRATRVRCPNVLRLLSGYGKNPLSVQNTAERWTVQNTTYFRYALLRTVGEHVVAKVGT
jgi:hypothetical protein